MGFCGNQTKNMTTEEFNLLIEECSKEIPDFYDQAIWRLIDGEEPNSTCITVELQVNLREQDNQYTSYRIQRKKSITQDSDIRSAISCLNEELLRDVEYTLHI